MRIDCARHVDLGEAAAGVEEAVGTRAVAKMPDDLPRVVDAVSGRCECARHVDLGEAVIGGICGRASSHRGDDEKGDYGKHSPTGI